MENKVTKEIFNPINENIKKLESLFPEIVKDGQVDFEALKQELGQFEEIGNEKYELTWPGKTQAKQLANTDIIGKTLKYVPEDSKNPETTENLYIEGDNLEVLKLLRNSYYGKVKMIYIDPPYNTGNDFVYKDNFTMEVIENEKIEGNIDEEGNRLIKNQEGSGRFHSNWLNMMYPRLKIAKDLLSDDGIIFISIANQEIDNLKKVCDEIFGTTNFLGIIDWESKTKCQNTKTAKYQLQNKQEYILVYKKSSLRYEFSLKLTELRVYPEIDENGRKYRLEQIGEMSASGIRGRNTMIFSIDGIYPKEGNQWKYGIETIEKFRERGDLLIKNGKAYFRIREFDEEDKMEPFWSFISKEIGTAETAKAELKTIIGEHGFETVKPVALINKLIFHVCANDKNSVILDFFSGSGTTAHAIMQLNAEDRGNRKFIMVQLLEPCDEKSEAYKAGYKNICEIGKERIRRAGEKIKEDFKDNENIENLDIGFKVFRVDDTNIRWNSEVLKEGQITMEESALKNKDLIDFNPGFTDIDVVYEIMLRHRDFPLTSKIEKLSNIGERTYIFADAIVVCLEEKVTDKIVDRIAAIEPKPIKVIFRDSAFEDDISLKLNTMNRLDAQLKKHNQGKEQSYRVEFI
ncbi:MULTISPECIES: site-specific DNA-methyltransferase [unclassified Clostridium]|uniref:site-specific DNA-methyltransferase n=1 Tax=unclassified Clostridium TaxID=2614128 RepID=UPI000297383A|nr:MULTISPECIES: site-specific DNA-methyltransferase [unclassified Clostridium]EKQ55439.1 MAG: adenine specific DNA methylase Mod [Clostridium sp. Maddingley MBC34-26]